MSVPNPNFLLNPRVTEPPKPCLASSGPPLQVCGVSSLGTEGHLTLAYSSQIQPYQGQHTKQETEFSMAG